MATCTRAPWARGAARSPIASCARRPAWAAPPGTTCPPPMARVTGFNTGSMRRATTPSAPEEDPLARALARDCGVPIQRARRTRPPSTRTRSGWTARAASLAIQYWFYFPFNEWINHHEGDWEHIKVSSRDRLRARGCAPSDRFHAIGYEFYFHGWRYRRRTCCPCGRGARRLRDRRGQYDHVLVFVGGRGQFLWWSGSQSGGSYPCPRLPGGRRRLRSVRRRRRHAPARAILPAERFDIVTAARAGPARYARPPRAVVAEATFLRRAAARVREPAAHGPVRRRKPPRQPARRREWNAIGRVRSGPARPFATPDSPSSPELGINPDGLSAVHP